MSIPVRPIRAPVAKVILLLLFLGSIAPMVSPLVEEANVRVALHRYHRHLATLVHALTSPRG